MEPHAYGRNSSLSIFATCPPLGKTTGIEHLQEIRNIAQWSEDACCVGILVYTDNRLLDPWLVSQLILECTSTLSPLVAVQPVYMHPYTAAKMVASLGYVHGRRLYLNMVAGGFVNDLIALNDYVEHDQRYDRLVEYTKVVQHLLHGHATPFNGQYYTLRGPRFQPRLPDELLPGLMVSGSSEAGLAAAKATGAVAVQYPRPSDAYETPLPDDGTSYGIRIGVIARPTEEQAWEVALNRFPEDRIGQLTHQLAMKVSDSSWHRQISTMRDYLDPGERHPYWMVPFHNYKTFCPYLVGSYERVAQELSRYLWLGYRTFILDIPAGPDDFHHARLAFDFAEGNLDHAGTASAPRTAPRPALS